MYGLMMNLLMPHLNQMTLADTLKTSYIPIEVDNLLYKHSLSLLFPSGKKELHTKHRMNSILMFH